MQRTFFIAVSNIGNVVLTTSALERLHQCYPEAVIDIHTDVRVQVVLAHCSYRGSTLLKEKRTGWREEFTNAVVTTTLTVFGEGRPLRNHPREPQCAWIIVEDQTLDSLSARSIAKRHRTPLNASANARRN